MSSNFFKKSAIGVILLLLFGVIPVAHSADVSSTSGSEVLCDIHTQEGMLDVNSEFCYTYEDPEGDDWYIMWRWGDGSDRAWLGPYASGETACISYTWDLPGVYDIFIKIKDDEGHESEWIFYMTIVIGDGGFGGPSKGKPFVRYTFWIWLPEHPQGDQWMILWDWGDGSDSGWLGPYDGLTNVTACHAWKRTGDYDIKIKLKDESGVEGDWSPPHPMAIQWFFDIQLLYRSPLIHMLCNFITNFF